jgi:hypothetical protein
MEDKFRRLANAMLPADRVDRIVQTVARLKSFPRSRKSSRRSSRRNRFPPSNLHGPAIAHPSAHDGFADKPPAAVADCPKSV